MQALGARRRKLKWGFVVGAVFGAASALLCYFRPAFAERIEFWSYDPRARGAAHHERAAKDIVMIDVDEGDIQSVERNYDLSFPWPRQLYAYITQYVTAAHPRAVLWDYYFQGIGQSWDDVKSFADALRDNGRAVIGFQLYKHERHEPPPGRWAAPVKTYPTRREALADALPILTFHRRAFILGGGPFTLVLGGEDSASDLADVWGKLAGQDVLAGIFPKDPPAARQLGDDELQRELHEDEFVIDHGALETPVPPGMPLVEYHTLDAPAPPLAAAAHLGSFVQHFDSDGVLRRYAPLERYRGGVFPTVALAAYLAAHPEVKPELVPGALILGDKRIPLADDGHFQLRFHGGNDTYPHVSSYKVLRSYQQVQEGKTPEIPPETFKDKYVVVSATADALVDVRPSPVAQRHLGAVINATAIDNLEHADVVRRAPAWVDALLALSLALLLAVGMVAIWSSVPTSLAAFLATTVATGAVLVGYWMWAGSLYDQKGLWVAVTLPIAGGALSTFSALLVASALERNDKRFIEKALNRYTSKALTTQLLRHPEYLALGGAKRDISVYFSDIAGFTTISEGLAPESLVALLNEYLTSMTDIVDRYEGYLDKYIGDAVMAFWGGLVPDEDHAKKAVMAAVEMRNECMRRGPEWKTRYGFDVLARSGVNSGGGVVGNMGSNNKYNYTAMGDMVNVASRLEGANKPYNTFLMISEFTHALVKDVVDWRELDYMTVKGKEKPIRAYEVLEIKGRTDGKVMEAIDVFHQGLELYRAKQFRDATDTFHKALAIRADDGPSKLYLKRCEFFLAEPPPDDWDGVWHMKEK